MAIPETRTFADCVDWSRTVTPYIPQLYHLPQQVALSITDFQALKTIYTSTNPLISAFAFSCALSPLFLIISEVNRNYSQIDRLWSILPTIYNIHFAVYAHAIGLPTKRLDTLAFFSIIWSCRLTYNYWRKGGYSIGSEDYRWKIVKDNMGAPLFFIVNIIFISSVQSILLFLITTPAYIMLLSAKGIGDTVAMADVIFSRGIGLLVLISFLADNQQWYFYKARSYYRETAKVPGGYHQEDLDRGFNVSGMFAWSRHPNFAAEQSVWITLYAWGAYITRGYINWTITGPIFYMLLFQASTSLTERISTRKYPEYAEYQKRVGKFLPRLPGGPPGDFSDVRKSK